MFKKNLIASQMVSIMFLNYFVLAYIGSAQALEEKNLNRLDISNELTTSFVVCLLLLLTDFVNAENIKEKVGLSMNLIMVTMFGINIVFIMISFFHSLKLVIKKISRNFCHFCIKRRYLKTPRFLTNISEFF